VTSFFEIQGAVFAFFSKTTRPDLRQLFPWIWEKTLVHIQPALKSNAPGL